MAESDLHLKLDRILAGQAAHQQALTNLDQSIIALTAGVSMQSDDLATQREILERLAEAMSKEQDGSELREIIMRIETQMAQMVADGERMITVLDTLPRAMSDAAIDGVRLALEDRLDVPANNQTQ